MMLKRQFSKIKFVSAILLPGILVLTYNACGIIQRPVAGSMNMASTFNHTGLTTCVGCHGPGKTFDSFPPSGHQNIGTQDCAVCHSPTGWKGGGAYSHTPTPASCNACHGVGGTYRNSLPGPGYVYQDPDGPKMDHSFTGVGDCVSCHGQSAGLTWAGARFAHSPAPSSCVACHGPQRPSGNVNVIPAPAGTYLTKVFNHALDGSADCKSCHTANLGTSWTGGKQPHAPVPASCNSCHLSQLPPTSALLPAAPTTEKSKGAYNHDPQYGTECKTCHTVYTGFYAGAWSKGYFEHRNTVWQGSGDSTQTCTPCHKGHGDGNDCDRCHTVTYPSPSSTGTYGGTMGPHN